MTQNRFPCLIAAATVLLAACASQSPDATSGAPPPTSPTSAAPPAPPTSAAAPTLTSKPEPDIGILWVRHAAEYTASAMQAYAAAAEDLKRMVGDSSWSALPAQAALGGPRAGLKPAIIFDIDETVVNNVEFQATLEEPFTEAKFDAWHEANRSAEVPGAAQFVQRARDAGVALFYITNRSCVPAGGDPCPQERIALDDLREAGITAEPQQLLLSEEQAGWTQEKQVRRDAVGASHRVIMLFGDDLGDFLPCVRKRVYAPCAQPATRAGRLEQTREHAKYWGEGWYVLPNPMYGSWTSVQ